MTRFLLMLPVSLPALHIFPFCNQLRPCFSGANELIFNHPVRTAVWRGRGAPWGGVCQGIIELKSSVQKSLRCPRKAALGWPAPCPHCLGKSGQWCPKALGFPGHTKKCCPWAVPMRWRVSSIPGGFGPSSAADIVFNRAGSCAGGTGAFQVLHPSGNAGERMPLFLEGIS